MQFTTLLLVSFFTLIVVAAPGRRSKCLAHSTRTVTKYTRNREPLTVTQPAITQTVTTTAIAETVTQTVTTTRIPAAEIKTVTVTTTATPTADAIIPPVSGTGSCMPADNIRNPNFDGASMEPWNVTCTGGATSSSSENYFHARLPSSSAGALLSQSGVQVCAGGRYLFGARFAGPAGCEAELLVGGEVIGGPYLAAAAEEAVGWDVLALYEPAHSGDVEVAVRVKCSEQGNAQVRVGEVMMSPR